MTGLRLLALDLSLTATGLAGLNQQGQIITRTRRSSLGGHERLQDLCVGVANACRYLDGPHLVVIEGLYVGQRNNTLELAELHGLVKQQLWLSGYPYVLVAPGTLKVYATGNGRAEKLAVQDAAEERYGRLCGDNNQADALCMLGMAADQYGHPFGQPVLGNCRRALDAVTWPHLDIPESPRPGGVPVRSTPPGGAGNSTPTVQEGQPA